MIFINTQQTRQKDLSR